MTTQILRTDRLLFAFLASIAFFTSGCNSIGSNDNQDKDSTAKDSQTVTATSTLANAAAIQPKIIETVVSKNYLPPVVNISSPALSAANLIVTEFNKWAAIQCSKKIDATLATKWEENRTKYLGKFPTPSTVLFLVLVDKFSCQVIGMVPESQTVRIKDNACSVDDIKVDRPDLIYDPTTTGFFTVKIKF